MSEEYEIEVIPVVVAAEPIELYKILKIESLVTSGSEAKRYIADGFVYVNGEVETRKRKKIMFGDIVGFNGEAYQVMSAETFAEYDIVDENDSQDDAEHAEYISADDGVDPVVESSIVESNIVEQSVVAPILVEPVSKPIVDSVPANIWEQPEKQKKSESKVQKSQPAEPKTAEKKKKGRAAPFNF